MNNLSEEETEDEIEFEECDASFICNDEEAKTIKIEIIPGNKKGSEWLVIDEKFIAIRNDK